MENEKELKIFLKNLLLIDLLIDNCINVVYEYYELYFADYTE